MIETATLRALWTLDPDVHFLNHGSFGACPRAVLEAQARYRDQLEREPVRFMLREADGLLDRARGTLAAFVGAEREDVVFVPNATTGVNAVLRSLELAAGDEILITDHGYNACSNAARFVTERAGARVVVAQLPFPLASSDEAVAAVLESVTDRTRIALLDHITSPTGLVLPLERLIPALRERGVETLVDGAHAPGMIPLDLQALDPAYYTGNCHKWICAPKGAALLYVRRELQGSVRPAVISHGANSPRPDRSRFEVEFGWVGTDDPTAYCAVHDAVEYMGSVLPGGWDEVRERNRSLALAAREVLLAELGAGAPAPDDMIGSLVTLPLADGDPQEVHSAFEPSALQNELFDRHRFQVPLLTWPAPPRRWMRVSAQLYNELDEYRALARALVALGAVPSTSG